jgi:uncharacterized membrane protein YhdT
VRVGIALFVLGLGFIVADVVPFFTGDSNRPLWLNLACLLAPLGFAIVLWAGLRAVRVQQRDALAQLADAGHVADWAG